MSGKIITVSAAKGGVGKTTILTNTAAMLAINNPDKKILMLDTDGQCNLISRFNFNEQDFYGKTILDFVDGSKQLNEIIFDGIKNEKRELIPNLYFLPCDFRYWDIDLIFQKEPQILTRFIQTIEFLKEQFDYIFIDTQPSITNLNKILYSLSNMIISPIEPDPEAAKGVFKMIRKIPTENQKPFIFVVATSVAKPKNQTESIDYAESILDTEKLNPFISGIKMCSTRIPYSTQYITASLIKKIPITLTKSKSKFSLAQKENFENISNQILEILE